MAYGIVHFFPGGTKEQYDATLAVVHPSRNLLSAGQVYHAAGASQGGWTVIAVHDSRQSWEKFRDEVLKPKMAQGIQGGFHSMPQEQSFEVYNLQHTRSEQQREASL
jgi:hypothetical protein